MVYLIISLAIAAWISISIRLHRRPAVCLTDGTTVEASGESVKESFASCFEAINATLKGLLAGDTTACCRLYRNFSDNENERDRVSFRNADVAFFGHCVFESAGKVMDSARRIACSPEFHIPSRNRTELNQLSHLIAALGDICRNKNDVDDDEKIIVKAMEQCAECRDFVTRSLDLQSVRLKGADDDDDAFYFPYFRLLSSMQLSLKSFGKYLERILSLKQQTMK